MDSLVLHIDTTASLRFKGGVLAEAKPIPSSVGVVAGAFRLVNAKQIDRAAPVGALTQISSQLTGLRSVGNMISVDLASENTGGRGILLVGSYGTSGSATRGDGNDRDEGDRGDGEESGEGGKHFISFGDVETLYS